MANARDSLLIDSVRQLVHLCKKMNELLSNDQIHYRDNSFQAMHESDNKKIELITQLNMIAHELSTAYPDGIIKKLAQQDNNPRNNSELLKYIEELKLEIQNCYQDIVINSNVVFSYLNHLKDIWDKVLAEKAKNNMIYDNSGNLVGNKG